MGLKRNDFRTQSSIPTPLFVFLEMKRRTTANIASDWKIVDTSTIGVAFEEMGGLDRYTISDIVEVVCASKLKFLLNG